MSPEFLFMLLLFVVLTIPIIIGAVVFINRATGEDSDEELEGLKQRVGELEAQQD